jgi:trimethylamine--corrinoid protein Co-methyltransferase
MPLELLDRELLDRILSEAFGLLEQQGARVGSAAARELLREAGAAVDEAAQVARLPEGVVRAALETAPRAFTLHDRDGQPRVRYGGDAVHFVPGSAAVHVLDAETGEHRNATTADLTRLVKAAEALPEFDAQSTAIVCADAPAETGDLHRLHVVLRHARKPIVTGAFDARTLPRMLRLLEAAGDGARAGRPRAIFDVCPSPPLNWTEFAAENLLTLARANVPAEIVAMPLAGATAPVTLAGAVTQHAAECLSGITLHQLARPGAPIVWGGAPSIFDMRHGTTPMGAMETAMIDAAYAQVGRHLGLPTQAYLGASDAKCLDAQAGMESAATALVGALAGINMIAGAGMLDFLACQSVEKLVVDAEAIGMARRLLRGISRPEALALPLFAELGLSGEFLGLRHTRQFFRREQRIPSAVIDRGSLRAWTAAGKPEARERARARVDEVLAGYECFELEAAVEREMGEVMRAA